MLYLFMRTFILSVLLAASAFAQSAGIITTYAGTGVRGFSGDGGPATRAQFGFLLASDPEFEEYSHPAIDSDGNLYIADQANDRIRKILADGTILTVAGSGRTGFDGDGGPALNAALFSPIAVAVDQAGNLYIVDQDNDRVRKVSLDGTINTIVGDGNPTAEAGAGNGGPAARASLNGPSGIALDPSGNLYVSDTFIDQVRKVTPAGIITAFAGDGTDAGFGGDGFRAVFALLDFPAGLAVDAAGNVYIADQHNNRIRKVSPDGIITTFAGNGDAAFSGDGGPAVNASLNYPADVALDAAGNLYIADQRNNRIRKVTPAGIITTVVGNGSTGFGGDGGAPLNASLNHPGGIAFDKQGNLYIVDHLNFRIRKVVFDPPVLAASATALAFAATAGGNAPAPQTFTLSNSGGGTLNYNITSNQPWLAATPASGALAAAATATITVRVNLANLAAGDYNGILNVDAPGAAGSPQVVRVALTVRPLAAPAPAFTASGITHAASFLSGPIAPGEIISIFGANLGPQTGVGAALDPASGRLSTSRAEVSVTLNDVPGPLFFVRENQINVQVPYEMANQTTARVVVRYLGTASAPVTVAVAPAAPGIFTASGGTGQAALLNQDSSANSAANPAAKGSVVQIFLTGQGATTPTAITGQLSQAPFPAPVLPVNVKIGGLPARTTFVGLAPGLAGLLQINAVVPEDAVAADNVALEISVGPATTQSGVTLAVR